MGSMCRRFRAKPPSEKTGKGDGGNSKPSYRTTNSAICYHVNAYRIQVFGV